MEKGEMEMSEESITDYSGWYRVDSKCHTGSPAWVLFNENTGFLIIRCSECDQMIVGFQIAKANSQ